MSRERRFLDEQGMTDLARKSIEVLRQDGASATELCRLEALLNEGNIGEAFIMSSLLRTIVAEISPEASQKKLLLVQLSSNLFDIETWQHFRHSGHERFENYCAEMLGIAESKLDGLKRLKDQLLPRPKKAGAMELFNWLFNAADILAGFRDRNDQ